MKRISVVGACERYSGQNDVDTDNICRHNVSEDSGEAADDLREAQGDTDAVYTAGTEIQTEVRVIPAGRQANIVHRAGVEMDIVLVG